jgi:membrane protease YdiL (CAAX protease family)
MCVAWLIFKRPREKILNILLIGLTVYAAVGLSETIGRRYNFMHMKTTLDADQAEVDLYFGAAQDYMRSLREPRKAPSHKDEEQYSAKARLLIDRQDNDNPIFSAYRVILLHHLGCDVRGPLTTLQQRKLPEGPALASDLAFALNVKPQPNDAVAPLDRGTDAGVEADLKNRLPPSWYLNKALESLYKTSGQDEKLGHFIDLRNQLYSSFLSGTGWLVAAGLIVGLAGIAAIVIHVLHLSKQKEAGVPVFESSFPGVGADYRFKVVTGIVLAHLFTWLTVGFFIRDWYDNQRLTTNYAFWAVLLETTLYMVSNGCILLYLYIFALRPKSVSFLNGIQFHTHIGKTGPARLIFLGFAGWCAMLPTMIVFAAAAAALGLRGSSNAILLLESLVARSSDIAAIVFLFITVAVLGPFIEEAFMRGYLYTALRQKLRAAPSILISGALFAAMHYDFDAFIPLLGIGMLLGYLMERYKTIVPSFICHGLWNGGLIASGLIMQHR